MIAVLGIGQRNHVRDEPVHLLGHRLKISSRVAAVGRRDGNLRGIVQHGLGILQVRDAAIERLLGAGNVADVGIQPLVLGLA